MMMHLTKEFSAENLVSVVEMQQFSDFYADRTEKEIEEMEKNIDSKYKPMRIKCSFIGGEVDMIKATELISQPSKSSPTDVEIMTTILEHTNTISHSNGCNQDEIRCNTDRSDKSSTSSSCACKDRGNTDKLKELMAGMSCNNVFSASKAISKQRNNFKYKIVLPTSTPKSSIVFDKEICIRHKIVLLCDKFIVTDAELELNISSSCKDTILQKVDRIKQLHTDECKTIFDEVLGEIFILMHGSLSRFRLTREYAESMEQMELDANSQTS
eukprot:171038_1